MTDELALLRALDETRAFDPVPLPHYRTSLYVPFETLTGRQCETPLGDAISGSIRTAVIGPIGCGKSSLVEHVVGQRARELAPILVSAAHEGDETLSDPVEFGRHLIRQVVRWARQVSALSPDEEHAALRESARTHPVRTRRVAQTLGVALAGTWIEPSWSREIEETLADPEVERSGGEILDSLDRLVDLVYGLGRTPVLIVDDTDRWLRGTRDVVLEAFFRDTFRTLAERNWSIVFAVQPEYCASPGFRVAAREGFLNRQLDVPRLEEPAAVRLLFAERIARRARDAAEEDALELGARSDLPEDPGPNDVFEDGFEEILFERYDRVGGNLRSILTVADQALRESIARGDARITNAALTETILALT